MSFLTVARLLSVFRGTESFLRIRSSGNNRALVGFDPMQLSAVLDTGALISAQLELYIESNADNTEGKGGWRSVSEANWGDGWTVDAHRLDEPWRETAVTWACAIDTDTTNSVPDCAAQWDGGSYAVTASDTVVHANGLTGWVSFDVTADLDTFVSGEALHGWLIRKTEEGAAGQVEYAAREDSCDHAPRLVLEVQPSAADTAGPLVTLVVPERPYVINDSTPQLELAYFDRGAGIDSTSAQIAIDNSDSTGSCSLCQYRAICQAPTLTGGAHTITVAVQHTVKGSKAFAYSRAAN